MTPHRRPRLWTAHELWDHVERRAREEGVREIVADPALVEQLLLVGRVPHAYGDRQSWGIFSGIIVRCAPSDDRQKPTRPDTSRV